MEVHDYIQIGLGIIAIGIAVAAYRVKKEVKHVDLSTAEMARENSQEIKSLKSEVLKNSETLNKYEFKAKKK